MSAGRASGHALGRQGEAAAARELRRAGLEILEVGFRSRLGEIDLIAREGETIVFVEVKARVGRRFGEGADAVTRRKRHRMAQTALDYLARHRLTGCPCRFDVVSIQLEDGDARVEVFQNAFDGPC